MGRHQLARKRRKSSMVLAVAAASAAAFFAAAGDVHSLAAAGAAERGPGHTAPWYLELVAGPPRALSSHLSGGADGAPEEMAASRMRADQRSRLLPAGVAPEQGLQVRTILTARNISATFPQIHEIGGCRPDVLRWHPEGLALDVMIPDPGSSEGIALGNEIVSYVLSNATRFGIQDAIWRGIYYTPDGGAQSGEWGHYDHV